MNDEGERPISVVEAERPEMVGRCVSILGRVPEFAKPTLIRPEIGDPYNASTATLADNTDEPIMVHIEGQELIDAFRVASKSSALHIVTGMVVNGGGSYMVVAMKISKCDSALGIILSSSGECMGVADWAKGACSEKGWTLLDLIVQESSEILGIACLDSNSALREAIEVAAMQAVSGGKLGKASWRIHMLLIGPPAAGKQMVGSVAELLNPCCERIGMAVSKAGIIGYPAFKNGKWSGKPGAIPRAHHGVVILEDYHRRAKAARREFECHLLEAMENGTARDSKAGNAKYECLVSFLVDTNLPSQVHGSDAKMDSSVLPGADVLNRIDYVSVMPDDDAMARETADRVLGIHCRAAREETEDRADRERRLKVLVALAREQFEKTSVPERVIEETQGLFEDLVDDYDSWSPAGRWLHAFLTRKSIQAARMLRASAVLSGRKHADFADVDRVERLMNTTLKSLRRFVAPFAPHETLLEAVHGEFAGRTGVSVNDVKVFLNRNGMAAGCADESMRVKAHRLLDRLVAKGLARHDGFGCYAVFETPDSEPGGSEGRAGDEPHPPIKHAKRIPPKNEANAA